MGVVGVITTEVSGFMSVGVAAIRDGGCKRAEILRGNSTDGAQKTDGESQCTETRDVLDYHAAT